MTAPTLSAYPPAVEALIPQARTLVDQLGEIPSRNRLMKEFKVGAPKAVALREALTTDVDTPAEATVETITVPGPDNNAAAEPAIEIAQADPVGHPDTASTPSTVRRPVVWPVFLLALPAFVAIWAGWVELGRLTGFGRVSLLPGIADSVVLDTAITLPIGVETYAAFALYVWLSGRATEQARRFAKRSAIASLGIGALGQIAYHLMAAAGWTSAPWLITAAVACLPVAVLGMGAALAHLLHTDH